MRRPADGSRSDGFSIKVLPHASAIGNIHIGTIAGKLNGVMPAQTPSGWRTDQLSMPRPTCSVNSPFSRCGMPQANSTTSMPRVISPWASENTLPCSSVMTRAIASPSRPSSSRNLNRMRARVSGGVAAQPGKRRGRGLHRPIDLASRGKGDAADLLAGRRVVDVAPAPARPVDPSCRRCNAECRSSGCTRPLICPDTLS